MGSGDRHRLSPPRNCRVTTAIRLTCVPSRFWLENPWEPMASTYSPQESISTFDCFLCGNSYISPNYDLSENAINELREAGFICLFCKTAFYGKVFKGSYQEYLQSPQWKAIRKAAIERAEGRCQVCNSDLLLQVHHRKYPEALGYESPNDLTVLCRRCHDLFHNMRG